MDVVMLAAGTSSRMGKENKMLLPYNGIPMLTHCCMQALRFLESHSKQTGTDCRLIVVTGYRRQSAEKALLSCKLFIENTDAKLEMIVVNNPNYRNGQFSSTKVGISQVSEYSPFFISLADMPLIGPSHYEQLVPLLGSHDAVRPFYEKKEDRVPGHPVLHASKLKDVILKHPDNWTVSRILKQADVDEPSFEDPAWSKDIDSLSDYQNIN